MTEPTPPDLAAKLSEFEKRLSGLESPPEAASAPGEALGGRLIALETRLGRLENLLADLALRLPDARPADAVEKRLFALEERLGGLALPPPSAKLATKAETIPSSVKELPAASAVEKPQPAERAATASPLAAQTPSGEAEKPLATEPIVEKLALAAAPPQPATLAEHPPASKPFATLAANEKPAPVAEKPIEKPAEKAVEKPAEKPFIASSIREAAAAAKKAAKPVTAPAGAAPIVSGASSKSAAEEKPVFLAEKDYKAPRPTASGASPAPHLAGLSAAATAVPVSLEADEPRDWEDSFATTWLPRIGGVLLLIGAAYLATLVTPRLGPGGKLALGYACSGAIFGGGWLVRRRNETIGRGTMAIGAALAYFASFASYYIPATQIFPWAIPALFLMAVFAGVIVAMAEIWRSESVAIIGCGLATLAALVSAPASQSFALIALGMVAAVAGVLLVRHEWKRLNVLALGGVYGGAVALWFLADPPATESEILVHLGALASYHAIFTAAFWRWSRPWVARERAADVAADVEAAPRMDLDGGWMPYSTGVAILNSAGLIALSLFLFWHTKILLPEIHLLLFALAGSEAWRLTVPALRRGNLWSFHWLTTFGLTAAALASAFSGLGEGAALSAQTMILAVAASRSRPLRWLRPLATICAILAAVAVFRRYGVNWPVATPLDFMMSLTPGLLLLASCLPWELLWVERPKRFETSPALALVDGGSGQLRGWITAFMLVAPLYEWLKLAYPAYEVFAWGGLSLALLLAMTFLRARALFLGALMGSCAIVYSYYNQAQNAPWTTPLLPEIHFAYYVWLVAAIHLWNEFARAENRPASRVVLALALGAVAGPVPFSTWMDATPWRPFLGLWMALLAVAACALSLWGGALAPCRPVAIPPEDADLPDSPAWLKPGWFIGALAGAMAVFAAMTYDAMESRISAACIAGAATVLWLYYTGPRVLRWSKRETLFAWLAAPVLAMANLTYGDFAEPAILRVVLLGLIALAAGGWRLGQGAALAGLACLCAAPMLAFGALENYGQVPHQARLMGVEDWLLSPFVDTPDTARLWAIEGLLIGALTAGASWAALRCQRRFETAGEPWNEGAAWVARGWLTFAGTGVVLFYCANSGLLGSAAATVAWVAAGMILLLAGRAFDDPISTAAGCLAHALALWRFATHDIFREGKISVIAAASICGAFLLAGLFLFEKRRNREVFQGAYAVGGLLVAWLTALVAYRLTGEALFCVTLLSLAAWLAGAAKRERWFSNAGLSFAAAAPMAGLLSWGRLQVDAPRAAIACLGAAALLVIAARLFPIVRQRLEVGDDDAWLGFEASWWFLAGGAASALLVLSAETLVGGALVTVSWGVVGGLMLAAGLIFPDDRTRRVAYGIFGAAVLRVFYHDVAMLSPTARAVAFFGLGLLLVGASLGYAALAKKKPRRGK